MNQLSMPHTNFRLLYSSFAEAINKQNSYERTFIDLIASDNARPRRQLGGALYYEGEMTQEGIVGSRPYAGAKYHDEIETLAIQIACKVFSADHANVQLHSCSQANQSVYFSFLNNGDPVLSLDFKAGGHLTHGRQVNFSGRHFNFGFYGVDTNGYIDYDELASKAKTFKPKLILCGASAYPRAYDYPLLKNISDDVGAFLMFDIAHEAGLIAAGVFPNPTEFADAVTMSLDKTMRGVSSAIILCKESHAAKVDRGVHPGTQSSFPIRRLAETGEVLLETQTVRFREYSERILANAQSLAKHLLSAGISLVTGGTDKHFVVADIAGSAGMSGAEAEKHLEQVGILSNRQMLPTDISSRFTNSGGLRLGTAWISSRGFDEADCRLLASAIVKCLAQTQAGKTEAAEIVVHLLGRNRDSDVWR